MWYIVVSDINNYNIVKHDKLFNYVKLNIYILIREKYILLHMY